MLEFLIEFVEKFQKLNDQRDVQKLGILIGSYHAIVIENLGMRGVAAKFVLGALTAEEEEDRQFTATDFLQCTELDADFLGNMTGDKTWIYKYNPETNAQLSVWKSLSTQPKTAHQV